MVDLRADLAGLLSAIEAFELTPRDLQVLDPSYAAFDASRPVLVMPPEFEAARRLIEGRYPAAHGARVLVDGAVAGSTVASLSAAAAAWLIDPLPPDEDFRSLSGLRAVMERLYGPNGCPWDREQTHESLRRYLLEEVYELVDAIDRGDRDALREELGDVLAHIFMQTSIAQESGEFAVEDVTAHAAQKMVRRHPHVFGDEAAESMDRLLGRWEEIKAAERAERGDWPSALASVPLAAPALQRAQALQRRALRAGALAPSSEAVEELAAAVAVASEPAGGSLAGVLWAAVRVASEREVDAEEVLREAADRFASAFAALEAASEGGSEGPEGASEEERRAPWRAATDGAWSK